VDRLVKAPLGLCVAEVVRALAGERRGRAELEALIVLPSCPQDIVQTNALAPGPLAIELL
jgi:hypothetical protein